MEQIWNRMSSSPSPAQVTVEAHHAPNSRAVLHLLYHEISADPGAYKYALGTTVFREHLRLFRRLQLPAHGGLWPEITFDDGHLSNFDQALPLLTDAGLSAHFFITAGWTEERPEYMNWQQLRQIVQAGHTIGAHGWSHKLLTHCSDGELETELGRTKEVLQDKLGASITSMSLPGGRFNARVLTACRDYGYEKIFTSIPRAEALPLQEIIGRLNLRSDASAEWLELLLASPTGPIQRMERQYRLKAAAQRLLGDRLYGRLWALLNRAEHGPEAA